MLPCASMPVGSLSEQEPGHLSPLPHAPCDASQDVYACAVPDARLFTSAPLEERWVHVSKKFFRVAQKLLMLT